MAKKKLYMCTGENYVGQFSPGLCGPQTHTLTQWIRIIFSGMEEEATAYFEGWNDKEIIDYLYKNCGKRLEKVKS